MDFVRFLLENESRRKLAAEAVGAVADDIEAATARGTISRKRGDDQVSIALDALPRSLGIGFAVRLTREKMENGAIVPHVEFPAGQASLRDVGGDPRDRPGVVS